MNRRQAKKVMRDVMHGNGSSLAAYPWRPRREERAVGVLVRLVRRYDWREDRPWTLRCVAVSRLESRATRSLARRRHKAQRGYGTYGFGLNALLRGVK